MSNNQGASPLATLCYKAGSTLDEVLALEEEELVELSKEIVGNNVLDHARVIKQWRRCRLEEVLRKEVEAEMVIEERDETEEVEVVVGEETILQQLQDEEDNRNKLQQYRKEQEEAIGEDWQEYLRKQIRQEMQQRQEIQQAFRPNPRRSVPSVIAATSSCTSHHSEETSFEEETWYSIDHGNALQGVQTMAANLMGLLEEGISDFLLGPPDETQKKRKKKSKTKEEPKGTNRGAEERPKLLLAHKFHC